MMHPFKSLRAPGFVKQSRTLRDVIILSCVFFSISFSFFSCGDKQKPKELVLNVDVTKVLQQDVSLESEYTGQTYGQSDIKIAPRVYGLVQSMDFKEGTVVKAGQKLYTIDPLPYVNKVDQAQAALNEAKTKMVRAKADLDMIEPLAKMNAVSQRELISTRAVFESSKAAVQSAEAALRNAQIELGFCTVTAPISGLIGISKVRVGDYVSQGPFAVLNTISQLDTIRVRFTISEQEFMRIQHEVNAENSGLKDLGKNISLVLPDGSPYVYKGVLNFADRQVDPTTGAITIEAGFINPDRLLRPGQYVKVKLVTSVQKQALLIPQRSVIEMQGIYQVYVLGDSDKVHLNIIQPGAAYKDAYLIKDGLKPTDVIAIGGTQLVKNGSKITPVMTKWLPGQQDNKAANN